MVLLPRQRQIFDGRQKKIDLQIQYDKVNANMIVVKSGDCECSHIIIKPKRMWCFWDEDPKIFSSDPDPTLIRNEKKKINEKKYLYYSNSSPPIRSFGFIQEFS